MSNCQNKTDSWEPCYASPEKGIAFFDGVVIESDSITDPRYDRVLPVLEEEQIFMCRQMLPVLEKVKKGMNNRPLVLDVGTGSGVFAIWAAKNGCHVVAIDINPRAIRFAKKNVRKNNLRYADSFNELSDNAPIVFLEEKFDAEFEDKLNFSDRFDIVILAPPYNPTCPGIMPALHAEAGEDGQEAFNFQIKFVPKVLKDGGYCIGNHMSTVVNQEISAFNSTRDSFNGHCKISFLRIIRDDIPVTTFLNGQYEDYLLKGSHDRNRVKRYIERMVEQYSSFSLIYFEIEKQADSTNGIYNSISEKHFEWADRIWLHKEIVNRIGWQPCYVSPEKGDAFFDGITIKADAITDPRYDRVIPILEEEQIYVCRQMLSVLLKIKEKNPKPIALDIGTGSGVYAIWAAKHGFRVIAIDINPRAVRIAKQNARENGIEYCESSEELSDDKPIVFLEEGFGNASQKDSYLQKKYDLIMLSPPYNPTCPGIMPALHAEAGADGQKAFNFQINQVPQLLKKRGYCVGNQMTTVVNKKIRAIETINNAFEKHCKISYVKIIKEDIPTERFLEKQYCEYLKEGSPNIKSTKQYIDSMGRDSYFSFIYYEIEKTTNILNRDINARGKNAFQFEEDHWDMRIWAHREVVNNIGTRDYFSIPALFLDSMPLINFKSNEQCKGSYNNDSDALSARFESSPLKLIDDYVKAKSRQPSKASQSNCCGEHRPDGSVESQRFLNGFDFICIDSAPIYPSFEKTKDRYISAETKMWIGDNGDFAEFNRLWQLNTAHFQEAKMGPFLHPAFVGLFTQADWMNMDYTFMEDKDGLLAEDEELGRLSQYDRRLQVARDKISETPIDVSYSKFLKYSETELGTLGVPNPSDYWLELDKPERLPLPKGILNKTSDIMAKYYKVGVFSALEQDNFSTEGGGEEKRLLSDILKEDLRICHYQFHKSIHTIFRRHINYKWSVLIGLPLGIEAERTHHVGSRKSLPELYKGGVWIFAASKDKFTLRHENELLDLARFAWMIFMEKISTEITKRTEMAEWEKQLSHQAHEIQKIISVISDKTPAFVLDRIRDYFKIVFLAHYGAVKTHELTKIKNIKELINDAIHKATVIDWIVGYATKPPRGSDEELLALMERRIAEKHPLVNSSIYENLYIPENVRQGFYAALVCLFRNTIKNMKQGSVIEYSIEKGFLKVENQVDGKHDNEGVKLLGTKGSLQVYAERYGADPNGVRSERLGKKWLTVLPLPQCV